MTMSLRWDDEFLLHSHWFFFSPAIRDAKPRRSSKKSLSMRVLIVASLLLLSVHALQHYTFCTRGVNISAASAAPTDSLEVCYAWTGIHDLFSSTHTHTRFTIWRLLHLRLLLEICSRLLEVIIVLLVSSTRQRVRRGHWNMMLSARFSSTRSLVLCSFFLLLLLST